MRLCQGTIDNAGKMEGRWCDPAKNSLEINQIAFSRYATFAVSARRMPDGRHRAAFRNERTLRTTVVLSRGHRSIRKDRFWNVGRSREPPQRTARRDFLAPAQWGAA
jgi:hypothetical protein